MAKKFHILISEDERLNFILLKKLIEKLYKDNLVIYHAINGEKAVEICNENIDLVLMDVEMPIVNGFEASELIKTKFPNIPIVMQTAHCTQSHKEKALAIGCDAFLAKPIIRKDFEDLLNVYAPKELKRKK